MAADPVWKRRVLEAPRVERVEALAENGVTLKILGSVRAADQWAAAGDFRKRLLAAFKENGIEMPRPQRRRPRPATSTGEPSLGPDDNGPAEGTGEGPSRRRGRVESEAGASRRVARRRASHANARIRRIAPTRVGRDRPIALRAMCGRGYDGRPADIEHEDPVSVEQPLPSPEIENLLAESPALPAGPGVRRPGQRDGRAVRGGRAPTSRRSGRSGRASGSTGRSRSTTTLEWDLPFAKWFTGGELNVAYNCVDRHVERGLGDKVAYHWIGEPGDTRTLTFARPAARGQQGRQRAQGARRRDGRPGRHLHADDPGAADRDARLRPDRRAAHGRLRRLLGRGAVAAASTTAGPRS